MKRLLYRRIFIPSLVVACSLLTGGWLSDMAHDFDASGANSISDESAMAAEPHAPGSAMLAMGPSDICAPGGPGMFPPPPGMGGPGMLPTPPGIGGPMMLPLGELDLSDDQVERLAGLKATTSDKAGLVIVQLHSLEHEFRAALVQSELNTDRLTKLQGQLSAQKQKLDTIFSDSLIASAQVLTPSQRNMIKQKLSRAELGPMVPKKTVPAEKNPPDRN